MYAMRIEDLYHIAPQHTHGIMTECGTQVNGLGAIQQRTIGHQHAPLGQHNARGRSRIAR